MPTHRKKPTAKAKPISSIVTRKSEMVDFHIGGTFKNWLPLAGGIFLMAGLIHVAVQQDIRQSANDPQIQMAEDAAEAIVNGTSHKALVADFSSVNIEKSLAPFVVTLDGDGVVSAASGTWEDGTTPVPPEGVLNYARQYGEDRLTWEPKDGVRIATVVKWIGSEKRPGWVIAGRSLREVEMREDALAHQTKWLGLLALIGTWLLVWAMKFWKTSK